MLRKPLGHFCLATFSNAGARSNLFLKKDALLLAPHAGRQEKRARAPAHRFLCCDASGPLAAELSKSSPSRSVLKSSGIERHRVEAPPCQFGARVPESSPTPSPRN